MTATRITLSVASTAIVAFVSLGLPLGVSAETDGLITVGCSGTFASGETGTCSTTFRSTDSVHVESGTSFARLTSALGVGWRVEGIITDGVGDPYFAWHCEVDASSVVPVTGWGAFAISSCGGTGFFSPHGDSPPHPGTHTVTVTATAGLCAEGELGLCPYKATVKVRPGAVE